jgi:photosystem II stability/assembly factor-like uncharacterized protein
MKTQSNKFYYLVFLLSPLLVQSQNWEQQAIDLLPNNYGVFAVSAVNENVVWAVAWDRTSGSPVPLDNITKVIKTVDGGANWIVYDVEEATGKISFDIVAFDENVAMITTQSLNNGLGRGVFKTIDGGVTWVEKFHHSAGGIWIRFFNQNDGVIINRSNMATTNDGGENWVLVPPENIPAFQEDEFTVFYTGTNSCQILGDHVWFGTDHGRVYRSNDKGLTWEASNTTLGNSALVSSVAFKDPLNGIAIDASSSITKFSKTTDGGQTWAALTSSPDLPIKNITFVPGTENTLIGVGTYAASLLESAYSVNFGETWTIIDGEIPSGATQFINSTIGWSSSGRIFTSNQPAIYKWDGTDVFDCNLAFESFPDNPLTHTGSGSSSTGISFDPGSKNPSFTISGLNAQTNGNPNSRFIDEVTVTYDDGINPAVVYGVFTGDVQSSVNVDIIGDVQSLTVSLADGYDGNYGGNLSVSFSDVSYCGADPGCPDADNDNVCDLDDICPGFNDNLDDDGDGVPNDCDICPGGDDSLDGDGDLVPDACDICLGGDDSIDSDNDGIPDFCDNCTNETSYFSPNPLTHQGTGSSESSVTIPVNNTDISFTINDLNAKTSGNPSKRYIEQVTVSYLDGSGSNTYGIFSGDVQSSVNVNINSTGVQSVSILLTDIYDGDTGNEVLSVSMTDVTSCQQLSPLPFQGGNPNNIIAPPDEAIISQLWSEGFKIYPNPTTDDLNIDLHYYLEQEISIFIYNHLGQQVWSLPKQILENTILNIKLGNYQLPEGIYLLSVRTEKGQQAKQFVISRR